jgi:hypothetical protein
MRLSFVISAILSFASALPQWNYQQQQQSPTSRPPTATTAPKNPNPVNLQDYLTNQMTTLTQEIRSFDGSDRNLAERIAYHARDVVLSMFESVRQLDTLPEQGLKDAVVSIGSGVKLMLAVGTMVNTLKQKKDVLQRGGLGLEMYRFIDGLLRANESLIEGYRKKFPAYAEPILQFVKGGFLLTLQEAREAFKRDDSNPQVTVIYERDAGLGTSPI